MSIYLSGSMAFDRIMTFSGTFSDHILPEKIHMLNVSFMIDSLEEKRGGTAGNIAYSLALLGESPIILGSVGKDFDSYGKFLISLGLSDEGLHLVGDQLTAGAYITTDQRNNQITCFNPGAMRTPTTYGFPYADSAVDLAVISPGNIEDMTLLPARLRTMGIRYIFDPGQQIPVLRPECLLGAITGAFMLISNDYELSMIMKATGKTKAELLDLCPIIITTCSEEGSLVEMGDRSPHNLPRMTKIPVVPVVQVKDPTGAGDAYRAGLIKGLVSGLPVAEAAQLGSTCASFCVEQSSPQGHMFSMAEFAKRHASVFGSYPLSR